MRRVVGLTGPSGAGKTCISAIARQLGYFVIEADQTARAATAPGSPVLQALQRAFGDDVVDQNGFLRRPLLAQRAFASPQQTALLNRITHPAIVRKIREELECAAPESHILLDAPTLIESGADQFCDTVVAVLAPAELRLRRIMTRDKLTRPQALARLNAGQPDAFYADRADHILYNDKTAAQFQAEATKLLETLL